MYPPLALLSFLPLTTALQSIYLGKDQTSNQAPTFIAWFSDSDTCNDGVRFRSVNQVFNDCHEQLTLLGHSNITFSGCNTSNHANSYPTLPTGVNDEGVLALRCVSAGNPMNAPEFEEGRFVTCMGGSNEGVVNVIEYCS